MAFAARLVAGITRHWTARRLEWVLAAVLVAQAAQLLSSHDLATNRVYRVLAAIIREYTLGRVSLVLGSVWLLALALNGSLVGFRRISPWVRAGVSLAAAAYWTLWSITLYQATGPVTSVSYINHGALALLAAICFLTSAHEVAVADERAAACRRRTFQKT